MAELHFSTKRLQIDKANARMVLVIAIAAFVVVFSLIASRALLSQRNYQARVITEKEKARNQLKENLAAVDSLQTAYQAFVSTPENLIGGNPSGQGDRDGDNAKIVLDALPSKYDFPALATSLEKILTERNYKIESITGTDDEINQQANADSPNPEPVEMPIEMTVSGTFDSMKTLTEVLERSIRPFQLQSLDFTGADNALRLNVKANTFYQPAKSLRITTRTVQ